MQLVIPMSGYGERFKRAGYKVPKPLIQVDGKTIIEHVLDLFPDVTKVTFICNQGHLDNPDFKLRELLEDAAPGATILGIPDHKKGPVYAIQQAYAEIIESESVIVSYCDYSCYWDFHNFSKFVSSSNCDGCIPSYRGFHPHMLGPTNYAFLKEENGIVTDIQEKQPFTENRLDEYASCGSYYFKSGALLKAAFDYVVANNINVGGEYYVSLAYKYLFQASLDVRVFELEHFMQWGTPEDLAEYVSWSNLFKDTVSQSRQLDQVPGEWLTIMPLAGAGARFAKEGYALPKPLISVSGRPMVVQALADLPQSSRTCFVLRKDLPQVEMISQNLKDELPDAKLVFLERLSQGQAVTCLAGAEGASDNEAVLVGTCDSGFIYDRLQFAKLAEKETDNDLIVFCKSAHIPAIRQPKSYGWVQLDDNSERIRACAVKQVLSDPTSDAVVCGVFWFKSVALFRGLVEQLVREDIRVNSEFYLDSVINLALEAGLNVRGFKVDHYLSWGTPDELRTFQYWQSCFNKLCWHPYKTSLDRHFPEPEPKLVAEPLEACKLAANDF